MKRLDYDFDESVGYWVVMAARAFEKAMREELAPHGITYRQWQVLVWLAHEGELAQSDLARKLEIEAPTLVGILERMERDGWIVRAECAADRRKKLVRASDRVGPVWSKMVACARRVRARASRGVEPDRLDAMRATLADLVRNLEAGVAVRGVAR